jgi:hypothetical protein
MKKENKILSLAITSMALADFTPPTLLYDDAPVRKLHKLPLDKKQKKARAKNKRAKQARKINRK